jgi:hypothetical protein
LQPRQVISVPSWNLLAAILVADREAGGEEPMRLLFLGTVLAAGLSLTGTTNGATGPVNGAVIGTAANTALLTDNVDCRRYPHRHRGAKPHGFGFGCPKKPPAKKSM